MQFGSFVAGVEADINYIDRSNGSSVLITNTGTTGTGDTYRLTRGDANNYYGTLRGRLGFAFDRFLVFGTGGLAWGGKQGGVSGVFTPNALAGTPSDGTAGAMLSSNGNSNSNVGWALGGGVEYAFSNAWSVKLEYLHVDLGSKTRSVGVIGAATARGFDVSGDNKFDVVRAGVNFRF
jgi:outer membrane immunogenic protein